MAGEKHLELQGFGTGLKSSTGTVGSDLPNVQRMGVTSVVSSKTSFSSERLCLTGFAQVCKAWIRDLQS